MTKRHSLHLLLVAASTLLLSSCNLFTHEETHINVDPAMLTGKWQQDGSQVFWRYVADGTGVTWDESEDITEEESNLTFEWTINGDRLTHVFRGEQGNQAVPKVYTVKEISSSAMRWMDDYKMEYNFTKTE